MNFDAHFSAIIQFFQQSPYIGLLILAAIAIQACRKPKEIFKLLGYCLVLVVALYLLTLFFNTISTGTKQKDRMIYKTQKAVDE